MKLMFAADPGGCQEDGRMFSGTGMFCGQGKFREAANHFRWYPLWLGAKLRTTSSRVRMTLMVACVASCITREHDEERSRQPAPWASPKPARTVTKHHIAIYIAGSHFSIRLPHTLALHSSVTSKTRARGSRMDPKFSFQRARRATIMDRGVTYSIKFEEFPESHRSA